jgi:hypothetical protein
VLGALLYVGSFYVFMLTIHFDIKDAMEEYFQSRRQSKNA